MSDRSPDEFPAAEPDHHRPRLEDPARLSALRDAEVMDSFPEDVYDRAVRLATRITGVPVGLLSFVDGQRQFFKAQTGLEGDVSHNRQTDLDHSFCQYVVTADRPLAVADARKHPLLRKNLAIANLGVIAYLGIPIHGPEGETLGSFCAIDREPRDWTEADMEALQDISGMIENELSLWRLSADRSILVQELQHRVRNLFTIVSGMVGLCARSVDTADDMAKQLQSRIRALANVQDLVVPTADTGHRLGNEVSMQKLFATLIDPYLGHDMAVERLTIDGAAILLGPRAATSLALAVHELATNSAKYGALSTNEGCLSVTWQLQDNDVHIAWTERSGPPPEPSGGDGGFGRKLIHISVEQQLGGTYASEAYPDGLRCRITLPRDRLEA